MKHLHILLSILLLSSPVIGHPKGEHTLYLWETSSGDVWKEFGDKETHTVYKGDLENGEPNGLGVITFTNGDKYVGEWKNGKRNGQGTLISFNGMKYVGSWKNDKFWNGTGIYKNSYYEYKYVNGKLIE